MNLQYPDTLHLAISVSTTSSRFLLQFSSPILSLHFLLAFSSSVRSILPFSLIHSSFFHSSLSSSISIPSFILSSILSSIPFPSRLSFCLPSCLPFQSVSYKSDKHTENKNPTTICLLQTEGGYSTLFSTYPLCLFSEPPRNILKTRAIPDSLSYRLQEEAISL